MEHGTRHDAHTKAWRVKTPETSGSLHRVCFFILRHRDYSLLFNGGEQEVVGSDFVCVEKNGCTISIRMVRETLLSFLQLYTGFFLKGVRIGRGWRCLTHMDGPEKGVSAGWGVFLEKNKHGLIHTHIGSPGFFFWPGGGRGGNGVSRDSKNHFLSVDLAPL